MASRPAPSPATPPNPTTCFRPQQRAGSPVPPRAKGAPTSPSTMKELKDTLWKAADKLRGSLAAHQYKDVILGLVFLKYVSDAYDERREQIRTGLEAEGWDGGQIASVIDDR